MGNTGYTIQAIIDRHINELESLGLEPKAILIGSESHHNQFQTEMKKKMSAVNDGLDTCETTFMIDTYKGLPIDVISGDVRLPFTSGMMSPVQVTVESYNQQSTQEKSDDKS